MWEGSGKCGRQGKATLSSRVCVRLCAASSLLSGVPLHVFISPCVLGYALKQRTELAVRLTPFPLPASCVLICQDEGRNMVHLCMASLTPSPFILPCLSPSMLCDLSNHGVASCPPPPFPFPLDLSPSLRSAHVSCFMSFFLQGEGRNMVQFCMASFPPLSPAPRFLDLSPST